TEEDEQQLFPDDDEEAVSTRASKCDRELHPSQRQLVPHLHNDTAAPQQLPSAMADEQLRRE
ncbi:17044_t:CDS:1, partial [Acaulospora colombiana]